MKTDRRIPYGKAMDLLLDAVCIVDAEGRYLYVSAAFETIFGYTPEEVIGRRMIEFVHPDDRESTLKTAETIMAGNVERHFENRYIRKDGRVVYIMWSARWSESEQARVAVARDISERKRDESMRHAAHLISDATHKIEGMAGLLREIHRVISEVLPAASFFVALHDAQKDELSFPCHVDERREAPPLQSLESNLLCAEVIRSGRPLWLTPERRPPSVLDCADVGTDVRYWLGVPLQGRGGMVGAMVVRSYSDAVAYSEPDMRMLQFLSIQVAAAIERKQIFERLEQAALYDPLTELPNRRLFHDRLQSAVVLARRDRTCLAVLFLDLDRFKEVNDRFGHAVGDQLLQQVARRIRECVRESDTVGRIGGDEFLVLLQGIQVPQDAQVVAETIRTLLASPFVLDGHELQVLPSIGIAFYPEHGDDYRQLIRCADEAMYAAKHGGGNRLQLSEMPAGVEPRKPTLN